MAICGWARSNTSIPPACRACIFLVGIDFEVIIVDIRPETRMQSLQLRWAHRMVTSFSVSVRTMMCAEHFSQFHC